MRGLYYYTARDAAGVFVRGSIDAGSEAAALASLRTRALFVTSLEAAASPRATIAHALQFGPPSRKSTVAFFRSFAALTAAGVAVRRALDVAIEQCVDARLREALASVTHDIENGLALSEAMSRRPREFAPLHVTMVRAGETGGILDEVLDRLAGVLERDAAVRKRVAAALAYPAFVAAAALALLTFLLAGIVPMFESLYRQMRVPLPPVTTALVAAGTALRAPQTWIAALLIVAAAAALAVRASGTVQTRAIMDGIVLRAPVAGALMRKAAAATLARMLGTLLRSGVGLIAAIDVVSGAVASVPYRNSLQTLRQALREGSAISEPLAACGLYEPLFVQMVRVGEETGALDAMLLRAADYYDVDIEAALTALGSLLEPIMILVLGAAVAGIVAAVFIPLYTLVGNVK